jgi:phosphatidate cytidylyltransferase
MSKELPKRIITSFFLFTILVLAYQYIYILILTLIILSVLSWFEFSILIHKIFKINKLINIMLKFLISLIGLTYITFFSFIMMRSFLNFEDKVLFSYSLSLCIATDLGGILFGNLFKGKKLTKISPNKTRSGVVGSYFLSFLFMIIYYLSLNDFKIIFLIILTFAVSTTSQLGDLLISYIKRKAKVKNTSNLLPGHGGILDRIDGIIFGAPLGFILGSFYI